MGTTKAGFDLTFQSRRCRYHS